MVRIRTCKIKIVLLIALIIFCLSFSKTNSFAAGTPKVLTADDVIEDTSDKQLLIPLYIIDNSGMMGFRLELIYDMNQLNVDYVIKGNLTKEGSFDSAINTDDKFGRTSIIWYNTENVSGDGTIAFIGVTVKGDYDVRTIRVGYISEDTFDESWNDIQLDCYNIQIQSSESSRKTAETEEDIVKIDSDDIIKHDYNNDESYGVSNKPGDVILSDKNPNETDAEKIAEVSKNDEEINARQDALEEIKNQEALSKIDLEKIKPYIIEELAREGYDGLDSIPPDKTDKFWDNVRDNYISDNIELSNTLENVNISSIRDSVTIDEKEIMAMKKHSSSRLILPISIIIGIIVLIMIFVIIKKKNTGEK